MTSATKGDLMMLVHEKWHGGPGQCGRTIGLMALLMLITSHALTAQNAPNTLGQPLLDAAGDVRDDAFI